MAQRVKGQSVSVVVLQDGAPLEEISFGRSIEMNFRTELLQEGYLGETTDRYDTIYRGIGGRIEFHFDSAEVFNLITSIIDKARRRDPGVRFNIKFTVSFPAGGKVRVIAKDAEFGELPIAFGSRADYGTFNLEYGASEARVLPVS
jgi:hypothetical protein